MRHVHVIEFGVRPTFTKVVDTRAQRLSLIPKLTTPSYSSEDIAIQLDIAIAELENTESDISLY